MKVTFRRNTHDANGYYRSFPRDAQLFWLTTGGIIGELLRHEVGLTLQEIFTTYDEYLAEEPSGLQVDEMYVAWALLRLLEYGMITVEVTPEPSPSPYQQLSLELLAE